MKPKSKSNVRTCAQPGGAAFLRHPAAARLGIILVLFAIWEIAARWFVDPIFLSPPSRVLSSLGMLLRSSGVVKALVLTFWELSAAFLLSLVVGVSLGLAVGLHRFSYRSIRPIILLLYAIPQVTILPLFILYFGIGPAAKIAYGVSHGIFPILMNVIAGVQNIKPIHLLSARSMGASRRQIFRWVILPHMVPSLFTGMRLGMTAVLLGVLLAELYVSSAGIGYFTRRYTESFDPTKLFGLVALVAAIAIILNEIVRRAELKFGKWRSD
jgi:ABC-type nitrate/sulfonate/bicarbonate transport system permease component